ncbi:type VI secretion system protein TssA [Escherichia coli]|uniref:type VI secretion system protein TssA n=1 Tax=Escherichia coli TaxID=562 RepID=UPI0012FE2DF6|nr:type VI secretion system protein TssA [Escherichia coli]EJV3517747.1 type VI secretion system protein TssA [Escherichia coli]MVW26316.1 type VI secretion system protein TssA [Escherichia coli]HAW7153526.1 type VI secretion system protein TssA [Escherichia coli]
MNEINIDTLLQPFERGAAAGENIEYEPIYAEIRDARLNDPDYISMGEWAVSEPRRADWRKVRKLCEHVLRYQSKDIQVSCWYVEALTHLHQLEGMREGLEFLAKFISLFWTTCWPSFEEGREVRYSKLIRLDGSLSDILKIYPLLGNKEITHSNWYKALSFEHSASLSVEHGEDITTTECNHSVEEFKKEICRYTPHDIRKQIVQFTNLPEKLDEVEACYFFHTHEKVHIIFSKTRQTINELIEILCRFLPHEEPDENSDLPFSVDLGSYSATQSLHLPDSGMGDSMTRDKAIVELEKIAFFFRRTEPTSPVPYLLERAVRWSKMTMVEWLEELIKDQESLKIINRILKG